MLVFLIVEDNYNKLYYDFMDDSTVKSPTSVWFVMTRLGREVGLLFQLTLLQ
jgi:hypothetical protein